MVFAPQSTKGTGCLNCIKWYRGFLIYNHVEVGEGIETTAPCVMPLPFGKTLVRLHFFAALGMWTTGFRSNEHLFLCIFLIKKAVAKTNQTDLDFKIYADLNKIYVSKILTHSKVCLDFKEVIDWSFKFPIAFVMRTRLIWSCFSSINICTMFSKVLGEQKFIEITRDINGRKE